MIPASLLGAFCQAAIERQAGFHQGRELIPLTYDGEDWVPCPEASFVVIVGPAQLAPGRILCAPVRMVCRP